MLTRRPGVTSFFVFVFLVVALTATDRFLQWSRSGTLALQQLVIAVVLVPTAIYGFLTTAAAFEKTQATP